MATMGRAALPSFESAVRAEGFGLARQVDYGYQMSWSPYSKYCAFDA